MSHLRAVTHDGKFHPDDVFSAVVLKSIFPGLEVVRTRDTDTINQADIVFDVGRVYDPAAKRFDHHQPNAPTRLDGLPYSAFGLIWREFGERFCKNRTIAEAIDRKLVRVVDADDNGVVDRAKLNNDSIEIVDLIYNLDPLFGSQEAFDSQYEKAVDLAGQILDRLVECERSRLDTLKYVTDRHARSNDKRFVLLDIYGEYDEIVEGFGEALYFVSPESGNSSWRLQAVRLGSDGFDTKRRLPELWAGLAGSQLVEITGIEDAIFCHKNRHLIVVRSKQSALKLLDRLLSEEG